MNRHAYFRQQEKNTLIHHGIKGQKWGVRRYQNEDGSLTEKGRRRYLDNDRQKFYEHYKSGYNKLHDTEEGRDKLKNYIRSGMDDNDLKEADRLMKIYKKYDKEFDAIDANDSDGKWNQKIYNKKAGEISKRYNEEYSKPLTNLIIKILGEQSMKELTGSELLPHQTYGSSISSYIDEIAEDRYRKKE